MCLPDKVCYLGFELRLIFSPHCLPAISLSCLYVPSYIKRPQSIPQASHTLRPRSSC